MTESRQPGGTKHSDRYLQHSFWFIIHNAAFFRAYFFHLTMLIYDGSPSSSFFLRFHLHFLRLYDDKHCRTARLSAGTSLQRSPWIVASCWGSASDMNPWPRSHCTRSSSTTSSHTSRCPRLTSPRTHLPLSRFAQRRPLPSFSPPVRGDRIWTHHTVSFQDLLTRHKLLSAEFLEQHYDRVSPAQFM